MVTWPCANSTWVRIEGIIRVILDCAADLTAIGFVIDGNGWGELTAQSVQESGKRGISRIIHCKHCEHANAFNAAVRKNIALLRIHSCHLILICFVVSHSSFMEKKKNEIGMGKISLFFFPSFYFSLGLFLYISS